MRHKHPSCFGLTPRTPYWVVAITLLLISMGSASPGQGSNSTRRLGLTGLALGGIGAGTFRLMTDGSVREATLNGNWDCPTGSLPGCFAAIRTHESTRTQVKVLALNSAYHLPTIKGMRGELLSPQMRLDVLDPTLPISVSMLAFSPLIPFDIRNSSFPAATMVLQLHNPLPVPVEVSVALSWESMLGLGSDGRGHPTEDRTRVKTSALPSADGYFGILFSRLGAVSKPGAGTGTKEEMELLAYPQVPDASVTTAAWDAQTARPSWWDRFARSGDVSSTMATGAHPAAVVVVRLTLKPNEYASIPCAVSWYMPHLQRNGREVGRYYQNLYAGADEVGRSVLADWLSLHGLTEEWQQRLTFSNLPPWLVRKLISSTETLTTNSLLTRDGGFEYVVGRSRADIVANTPAWDQPNASEGLAANSLLLAFFPRLAYRMLHDRAADIARSSDPLSLLPRSASDDLPVKSVPEVGSAEQTEAESVFLIQLAAYTRWTGDEQLMRDASSAVEKVLKSQTSKTSDAARDEGGAKPGLPVAVPVRVLMLQLAGLRAGRLLAVQMGENDLAQACTVRAAELAGWIEKERWNGECYGELVRSALLTPQRGCETDQLLGQWAADQVGLGSLLAPVHLEGSLHSLLKAAEGARSAGPATGIPLTDLWLGIAMPALRHGLPGQALALLEREETDVTQPGPGMSEEQEESQWLQRAAPWSMLNALAGVQIDVRAGKMALLPNLPGLWRSLRCPIFTPTFWAFLDFKPDAHGGLIAFQVSRVLNFGKASANKDESAMGSLLSHADLSLRSLQIPGPPIRVGGGASSNYAVYISKGRVTIGAKSVRNPDGTITLTFDTPLLLTAGDRLAVDLH